MSNMPSIKNLDKLLQLMKPKLIKGEFVFCRISEKEFSKYNIKPLLIFREKENITLILERKVADKNLIDYKGVWAMITLTVNSDLSAVGFLAAITNKLAEKNICVNVISAYYHDHLFVPVEKAEKTMQLLNELSSSK